MTSQSKMWARSIMLLWITKYIRSPDTYQYMCKIEWDYNKCIYSRLDRIEPNTKPFSDEINLKSDAQLHWNAYISYFWFVVLSFRTWHLCVPMCLPYATNIIETSPSRHTMQSRFVCRFLMFYNFHLLFLFPWTFLPFLTRLNILYSHT